MAPGATVTLLGTLAAGLSLVSAISMPPVGAATPSVTVPRVDRPPATTDGSNDKVAGVGVSAGSVATVTCRAIERDSAPTAPVIVASVDVVTVWVAIENVPEVAPLEMVIVAGTATDAELLDNVTIVPAEGAEALSVTLPCVEAPAKTLDESIVIAARVIAVGGVSAADVGDEGESLPQALTRLNTRAAATTIRLALIRDRRPVMEPVIDGTTRSDRHGAEPAPAPQRARSRATLRCATLARSAARVRGPGPAASSPFATDVRDRPGLERFSVRRDTESQSHRDKNN